MAAARAPSRRERRFNRARGLLHSAEVAMGSVNQRVEIREKTILDATHLRLCEKGYDDATTSSISQRANVAGGIIYKCVSTSANSCSAC
jgi:AcrR family transcriptional regulator